MRILFLADNFPPECNAQASRVYERARYWVEWGHQVTVVTCVPNFPEGIVHRGYRNRWRQVETISGIRVVRVKTYIAPNERIVRRMIDYLSFLPAALWAAAREESPDVVAATSPQMFAALAGWMAARTKRRPFLLEISDLWPESIAAVGVMQQSRPIIHGLDFLANFLYRHADRIVLLTESFRDRLVARGIPAGKLDVILNGADRGLFYQRPRDLALAESLGLSPDSFVLGYVGTLGMAHDLENVLDAADRLRGTRIRFLLVGNGSESEKLRKNARARHLDNVVFVLAQPRDLVPAYLGLCDAALVHLKDTPLFSTVIPSKLFEAMAMGLPVVLVAPRGETTRIVELEGIGVCVKPGDALALANKLNSLEHSPELRAMFSQRSLVAAPKYSRENQARLYLKSLAKTCKPRTKPADLFHPGPREQRTSETRPAA